jgi:hypothetical protein
VDIGALSIEIQQPLQADPFTLEPPSSTSRSDTAGFTYWQYPDQTLTAGQEITVQTRYAKSDPNPSIVRQQELSGEAAVVGSAVIEQPISPAASSTWITFTLIGVAFVVGAGLLRHRLRPQQKTVPTAPVKAISRPSAVPTAPENSTRPKYCTQCGQPLPLQARFCPYCGKGLGC